MDSPAPAAPDTGQARTAQAVGFTRGPQDNHYVILAGASHLVDH